MAKLANILGLMSGTSMDGIDAALLRTDGENIHETLGHAFTPYPESVREAIRTCLKTSQKSAATDKAEKLVTEWHIHAVHDFQQKYSHTIDVLGFHGQTIFHDPVNRRTWQLGDAQTLAAQTGIDVVHDFRSADMLAGGQGAPLLPLYHRALFKSAGPLAVLNLGGVGNITWMAGDDIIACDTGPANALIDDWMQQNTGTPYDKGGQTALKGHVDTQKLTTWMTHPFFTKPAPKSLDRNDFAHCDVTSLSLEDGAATLAAFTVEAVRAALNLMPIMPEKLIIVGGGRHNLAITQGLAKHIRIQTSEDMGYQGDFIEAEGFAYLAARFLHGLPTSLPGTTGCKTPICGGQLTKAA